MWGALYYAWDVKRFNVVNVSQNTEIGNDEYDERNAIKDPRWNVRNCAKGVNKMELFLFKCKKVPCNLHQ